jgi:hypothetical protein
MVRVVRRLSKASMKSDGYLCHVCTFVRMEQGGSYCTDFREFVTWIFFIKMYLHA